MTRWDAARGDFTTCSATEDGSCYFSLEIAQLTAERDALKADKAKLLVREEELRNSLSRAYAENERLRAEVARMTDDPSFQSEEVQELRGQLTELREAAKDTADQWQALADEGMYREELQDNLAEHFDIHEASHARLRAVLAKVKPSAGNHHAACPYHDGQLCACGKVTP